MDVGVGSDEHGEFIPVRRAEIGVDISIPKTRVHDQYVQASVENLPFRDKSFQVAFGFNLLEHIPKPTVGLRELRRVSEKTIVRQDMPWNINSYATPSHLWMQLPRVKFVKFPRTKIGIAFSRWLYRWQPILIRKLVEFRIEWAKGKYFSLHPNPFWFVVKLLTSERTAQYIVEFQN